MVAIVHIVVALFSPRARNFFRRMALGEASNVLYGPVHVINPGIFAHVDGAVSAAARRRLLEHEHVAVAFVFCGDCSPQASATVANNEARLFRNPTSKASSLPKSQKRHSPRSWRGCADSGKAGTLQEITTRKFRFIPFHFCSLSKAFAHEAHLQSPREVPFRRGEFLLAMLMARIALEHVGMVAARAVRFRVTVKVGLLGMHGVAIRAGNGLMGFGCRRSCGLTVLPFESVRAVTDAVF